MENVVIASFDPSIFSHKPLSDLAAFKTIRLEIAARDYPRLCTAHLALRVPIVLTTSANIRKYIKAGLYPKIEAVYYDPYTRNFHLPPPISQKSPTFESILNRTPSDTELVRFFQRQHNIAKQNYKRQEEHRHQPKARPIANIGGPKTEEATDKEDEIDIQKVPSYFTLSQEYELAHRATPLTGGLAGGLFPTAERTEKGLDSLDMETWTPFANRTAMSHMACPSTTSNDSDGREDADLSKLVSDLRLTKKNTRPDLKDYLAEYIRQKEELESLLY